MILQHANNSFHLKVFWPHLSTKTLLVCKLEFVWFFFFQTSWYSNFRIFVPSCHHDCNCVPVALHWKNQAKAILATSICCFVLTTSQRLTEFQFRKDPFWFSLFDAWLREKRNCLTYCTCSNFFYIYAFLFMSIYAMHRLHFLVNSFFLQGKQAKISTIHCKKKKYIAVCLTCIVWFVCIHLCTKFWFRKLNLALAVLQVLLAKIPCVINIFELGVLCNVYFYLQC